MKALRAVRSAFDPHVWWSSRKRPDQLELVPTEPRAAHAIIIDFSPKELNPRPAFAITDDGRQSHSLGVASRERQHVSQIDSDHSSFDFLHYLEHFCPRSTTAGMYQQLSNRLLG